MIKFEHGMLVLDNTATKDDVNAVNEFADYVRNQTKESIIKLLEEQGDVLFDVAFVIALIQGDNNEVS